MHWFILKDGEAVLNDVVRYLVKKGGEQKASYLVYKYLPLKRLILLELDRLNSICFINLNQFLKKA